MPLNAKTAWFMTSTVAAPARNFENSLHLLHFAFLQKKNIRLSLLNKTLK
jgi:hypothetical protein